MRRALRGIFGPNKGTAIGGWTKLHNEELHNVKSSQNIIGMMKSRQAVT
jgi:hypothetical protein